MNLTHVIGVYYGIPTILSEKSGNTFKNLQKR